MTELEATPDRELVFRRLTDPFPGGPAEYAPALWVAATVAVLLLAAVWVVRLYRRDARVLPWWLSVPLAAGRFAVYALLAAAFLLPAYQTWERNEKKSKVVFVVDVSPSVTTVADERATDPKAKAPTRFDKLLDALTDDKLALLAKLTAKNPVSVYRFGSRLDEEPLTVAADSPARTRDEWAAWLRGDLKAWVLGQVPPAARSVLVKSPAWDADTTGTPEWAVAWARRPDAEAVPSELSEGDRAAVLAVRSRLEKRADVVRAVGQGGTDLPGALTAAVNREAGNLVQAVVAFSDGRSTVGADTGFRHLKDRASRERIPVFTVAVGEARDTTSISITDVQAADRAPPDEPFKAVVEADGVGLANTEVEVKLGLYAPNHPVKDKDGKPLPPDFELTRPLKFLGNTAPPHGTAEFAVDPENVDLPDALTEPAKKAGKKRQLKQGAWNLVARIARDKREVTADDWHVSPPRVVQVLDKPLRVLMFAGAATREYQTLRTLLVRETQQNRAELSIYLQSAAGKDGTAVQDVPPERLLTRFPTRLDTSDKDEPADDKFGNLNRYDLVVAFDPDWSELSADQVRNLQEWVDNLGGGLVFVASPVNSYQLARADEGGRLKPLLDVLPVILDDAILLKTRTTPRTPRKLALKPNPEFDVLRLDDDAPADEPAAGWDRFFGDDKPTRGFFTSYPVKAAKPVSTTLAELLEPVEAGVERRPWLVAAQTKRGRSVFLASGEVWRLRAFDPDYYDRFWVKLSRYAAGNRDVKEARGRVLVGKEYPAGAVVRVQARLLAPNARPYPPDAVTAKFTVARYTSSGDKVSGVKDEGPFELKPRRSGGEFDGYYTGQFLADPARFPPGDFRYRVSVEVPEAANETVSADFALRRSDPELDDTKPDFAALAEAAGTLDEVRGRVSDPAVLAVLQGNETDPAKAKLTMKLSDRDKLAAVPACMDVVSQTTRSRGPARDLWDRGPVVTLGGRTVEVSWLLLAAAGLLGVEWLVRKLMRLA